MVGVVDILLLNIACDCYSAVYLQMYSFHGLLTENLNFSFAPPNKHVSILAV